MDKWVTGEVLRDADNIVNIKDRPKLTIPQQIAYMRDAKGIKFTIVNEEEAEAFLRESNYYFKLKAFEKNYSVYKSGENKDKYFNLELGQFTRNYTQTTKRGLLTTNKG